MSTSNHSPKRMSMLGFAEMFGRVDQTMLNRRFAFILGAGASKTSGIKLAHEMVAEWVGILHRQSNSHTSIPLDQWATAANLEIDAYDPADPAASYSALYRRMYQDDPDQGYAYLEHQMASADPSYGYSVLGRIMANSQHRVVITVNFDNLVADALSIFSKQYPLVCGHESLAGFAKADLRRPLVLKVHRDLLLNPMSVPSDLAQLEKGFADAIKALLRQCTPIVIGYGGNDNSLMHCLSSIPEQIPGGVYWCIRESDPAPSQLIQDFVVKQHGFFVPIPGFDELMMMLGGKLGIGNPRQALEERTKGRIERLERQLAELQHRVDEAGSKSQPISVSAVPRKATESRQVEVVGATRSGTSAELNAVMQEIEKVSQQPAKKRWWQWESEAEQESNVEKRDAIYKLALSELPDSKELMVSYADFLTDVRRHHDAAEVKYKEALQADPLEPNALNNYAVFLKKVRGDYDAADALYQRAIEADPNDAIALGNRANLLTDVRGDHDTAELLYKRAIQLDPKHTSALSNYATFLQDVRQDHDAADAMYKRAIEADSDHADNLGNYARLLLAQGRRNEGLIYLDRAFQNFSSRMTNALPAECWMYAYCCRQAEARLEALVNLKRLILQDKIRTGNWDFSGVIRQAEKLGHLEAGWLPRLAEVLAGRAGADTLLGWEAWNAAA